MLLYRLSKTAALAVIILSATSIQAQKPETFEQARAIAVQSQRPILLEFYRDG